MSQFKLSLLIPSRERYSYVTNLLDSCSRTVMNADNVEILFGIDNDDPESERHIQNISTKYPHLHIFIHKRDRSELINEDYYNWLARKATGKYLWVLGNDIQFITPCWDNMIEQRIEAEFVNKKDRIFCISVSDGTPKPDPKHPAFPCFPIFSKEALEQIGYLMPPSIPTWGADYLIYCIYHGIGRIYEYKDIIINHISYHTRQCPVDDINRRVGEIYARNKHLHTDYLNNHLPQMVAKLQHIIIESNR